MYLIGVHIYFYRNERTKNTLCKTNPDKNYMQFIFIAKNTQRIRAI